MADSVSEGPLKQFNGWTVLPPDVIETASDIVSDVIVKENKMASGEEATWRR